MRDQDVAPLYSIKKNRRLCLSSDGENQVGGRRRCAAASRYHHTGWNQMVDAMHREESTTACWMCKQANSRSACADPPQELVEFGGSRRTVEARNTRSSLNTTRSSKNENRPKKLVEAPDVVERRQLVENDWSAEERIEREGRIRLDRQDFLFPLLRLYCSQLRIDASKKKRKMEVIWQQPDVTL